MPKRLRFERAATGAQALSSVLPPRPFLGTIAIRAALLWAFLHAASSLGGDAEGVPFRQSLVGPPPVAVLVCAVVLVVMRVELWRRSESVFLANLGCSFTRIAAFIVLECIMLESLLRLTFA